MDGRQTDAQERIATNGGEPVMMQQEPEEAKSQGAGAEAAEIEDVESLKQALAKEKEKSEGYLAGWQRAQADFINYKRRCEQEKAEAGNYANAELILRFLPAIDDLERALSSIPSEIEGLAWIEGIKFVERKLRSSLEAIGLTPIKAVGETFDPCLHEAVRQCQGKECIVMEEAEKGYRFRDRVIRPSKVVVGSGEEKKEKEED